MVTLGDSIADGTVSIFTGPFGSALHSHDYIDVGVPVVPTEAIVSGRLDSTFFPKIKKEKADELSRYALRNGDLVFARRGAQACGLSAMVDEKSQGAIAGTGVIVARIHNQTRIDPKYFSILVGAPTSVAWLKSHAVGATMPNLNSGIISALPISFPPLSEQKAIARILGTLDDKIELNRRMNATLEAMARALFQSWFVDFDPVHAKAAGRPPSGMDAQTAALFPASFQDSELGEIPSGWDVKSLDEIAQFLNGLALQKFPPGDGETLPVIKIAQLRKGDTIGADRCSSELPAEYIIGDGDMLFSWSGSLEVELWCGGEGALNQHLFKVTSQDFPQWLYYHWTRHHLDSFRLIAASKATTMGHIQRKHLTEAKVLVPSPRLIEALTPKIQPLLDQIVANRIQSRTLATLRDTLLPKLLSGELSVAALPLS